MTDDRQVGEVGDIVEDSDGTKWYIQAIHYREGKAVYSRVQVGSLAAKLLGLEPVHDASQN